MAKKALVKEFICSACGRHEPKWMGRCPECGEWNSFVETEAQVLRARATGLDDVVSLPLGAIDVSEMKRVSSGIREFDRVLGGGLMKGAATLVGGEPGIGKSTLMLQLLAKAEQTGRCLYVSGEESAGQVKSRAERLGCGTANIELLCTGKLDAIMKSLERIKPMLVVVDSIQTLHSEDAGAVPGTVNQMKYASMELVDWAKRTGAAIFLIAHVTKEGVIAGPKAIEHLVDTVLYFEQAEADLRFLRSMKNRYGGVDELGIFRMGDRGLEEVSDVGGLFLVKREGALPPGICVAPAWEGSRVILVEIQALTVSAKTGFSRVYSDKIDSQRVSRVAAVLEKQTGIGLSDHDIYVNVAGGLKLSEVGIELPLAAAIYSARTGKPVPRDMAFTGEVSLSGELRPVRQAKKRLKAALAGGYQSLAGAASSDEGAMEKGWLLHSDLRQMISATFK